MIIHIIFGNFSHPQMIYMFKIFAPSYVIYCKVNQTIENFGLMGITIPIIAYFWMEPIQIGYVLVNNVPQFENEMTTY